MTGAKPFLFDRDFDGRRRGEEMVPMSLHLAAVAEAEQRGQASGTSAGQDAARREQTARLSAVLEKLAVQMSLEIAHSEARAMAQEIGAIELALELARKIAGEAVARYPLAAIEGAAQECFSEARTAPHVAVRVNETMVEETKAHLGTMAAERGFAGKLVILGEPDIPQGDIRLEWADGGVVRDRARIETAIEQTIRNHIASVGNDAAGERS